MPPCHLFGDPECFNKCECGFNCLISSRILADRNFCVTKCQCLSSIDPEPNEEPPQPVPPTISNPKGPCYVAGDMSCIQNCKCDKNCVVINKITGVVCFGNCYCLMEIPEQEPGPPNVPNPGLQPNPGIPQNPDLPKPKPCPGFICAKV